MHINQAQGRQERMIFFQSKYSPKKVVKINKIKEAQGLQPRTMFFGALTDNLFLKAQSN